MRDYYLYYCYYKYRGISLKQKRTLSRKCFFKVIRSSKMYRIFDILAILMTSSSDDVIKFSNFAIHLPSLCEATVKKLSVYRKQF